MSQIDPRITKVHKKMLCVSKNVERYHSLVPLVLEESNIKTNLCTEN